MANTTGCGEAAAILARPTLEDVAAKFQEWLHLPDVMPLYATLGVIAANHLPGDPVWLGLVAPPSSAKTEILNATVQLPHVRSAATLTPAGLLSGTSKRERAAASRGGLLRELGEFGILVMKDFGSVLSMRPDAKAETLAALREVYDGAWTRHIGTDGGQALSWRGKVGLLFGVTPVVDSHSAVMGAMGERFLLCRIPPSARAQGTRALVHMGTGTAQMRDELAASVAALFAPGLVPPGPLTSEEQDRLGDLAFLAVRLRSTVERDRYSREIENVHGAEGPARLILCLAHLFAGLLSLGCPRDLAMSVVERVARDSVPPLRRVAFEWLSEQSEPQDTGAVAHALRLPAVTVRRVLEDLAAYDLIAQYKTGRGRSDQWQALPG